MYYIQHIYYNITRIVGYTYPDSYIIIRLSYAIVSEVRQYLRLAEDYVNSSKSPLGEEEAGEGSRLLRSRDLRTLVEEVEEEEEEGQGRNLS